MEAASSRVATSDAAAQEVARAIALALGTERVRLDLRDAMRASPVTEHKLVLQDFVRTSPGRSLLSAAARASGKDLASLQAAVKSLAPLDFYVPAREHRLGWKGGADVLVAATISELAPTAAYAPSGRSAPLALKQAQPREALFVLQPAERKSARVGPKARATGSTIQDAAESDLSGTLEFVDENGRSSVVALADVAAGGFIIICPPDNPNCNPCPTCPPPPPPPPDTSFVQNFSVGDICDNGNCAEGNEFEFRAKFFLATGALSGTGTYRIEGIRRFSSNFVNGRLIFRRIRENTTEKLTVEVVETDGPLNGDDHFGIRTLTYASNGQIQSYFQGFNQLAMNVVYRWIKKF
jgi:hypothetical protein